MMLSFKWSTHVKKIHHQLSVANGTKFIHEKYLNRQNVRALTESKSFAVTVLYMYLYSARHLPDSARL